MKKMLAVATMLIMVSATISTVNAQGFNGNKIAFTNFVTRMYENNPFEGVKVVEDYDDVYLISVVALDSAKYSSEAIMNRVAEVKARAQALRFFNGASITLDMVVTTREDDNGTITTEMVEKLHEKSFGYVESMEMLTVIDKTEQYVYVYSLMIKQ
jgi:hypothetical protein